MASPPASSGTTYFIHADWLGTERARTTASGASYETCTSLPFGDALSCAGSTDPSPMHFTGKERDSESGLDNFGARYDASSMGRFMTPDPIHVMKQRLVDPQQWNLYGYVRNNPLNLTDPMGLYIVSCTAGSEKDKKHCNKAADNFEKQRQKDLNSKTQKVRDAAKAWGDRGQDNHISVTFKPQAQVDADAHNTDTANYKVDAIVKPGTTSDHQGTIQAEFSESLGGSSLAQTIAHEGSHIEDDMQFLNSFNPATGKYNQYLNFTHFDTEFQAFEVGSMVTGYSMFKTGPKGYQQLENYISTAYRNADSLVFPSSEFPQ
jgi:RHS repeat-associated protein